MRPPSSGSCVWGVDTSTKAVDIVSVGPAGAYGDYRTINLPKEIFAGAQTLAKAYLQTEELACELRFDHMPALVVVESPFVRQGGQPLLMNYGAILAALAVTVSCPVVEVASATWKAHAPGHGHADKDAIRKYAMERDFVTGRQDQADAFCMALYGHDLLRRRALGVPQNGKSKIRRART